jgi:hypothetical protein
MRGSVAARKARQAGELKTPEVSVMGKSSKFFYKHKLIIAIVVAGGVVVAGMAFFFSRFQIVFHNNKPGVMAPVKAQALSEYADKVVKECSAASYKPGCYEEQIPKLMDAISMRDAFEVTSQVQQQDPSYAYCHVLGHKLAARETAKDPADWKDVIAMCPSGVCSNGCIHGAFQERFRQESLSDELIAKYKPELTDICEARDNWHPTNLEQATCYHALGHLLMYITNADIAKATGLCQEMSVKDNGSRDYSQLCYDGAFMQIFQPLETEDFTLIEGKQPKKHEMAAFCKPFTGAMREPCWTESWPLVREQILKPEGLVQFCTNSLLLTEGDRNRCFMGMFYVVTAQLQLDDDKVENFCNGITTIRRGLCFANAASRMIETDFKNVNRAVRMCASATLDAAKRECYDELVRLSKYDFHSNSPEFLQLCNALPEPWKNNCLARN